MLPLLWLLGAADGQRRAVAEYLDLMGFGPQPTPSRSFVTTDRCRLFRFGDAPSGRPAVLLVPAPIKTGELWDLAPEVSVVRRFLEAGFAVYRMEWPEWTRADAGVGLDALISTHLAGCLDVVGERAGAGGVLVCGHSLGGTLAALAAARYPERVAGLVLLASPLHFAPDSSALDRLADDAGAVSGWSRDTALIPGSLLTLLAAAASPGEFVMRRGADWLTVIGDPAKMRRHLQMERWSLAEKPMPRALFMDLVERLYRADGFCAGTVVIDGRAALPANLEQPLITVLDAGCDLVTGASVEPALERLGTRDRQLLYHDGDRDLPVRHLSLLIGSDAHASIWPRLLAWACQRLAVPRGEVP